MLSTQGSSAAGAASSAFPTTPTKAICLGNTISLIEYKDLRFLILDCPTDTTLPLYLREFAKLNVTDVVRVCEPTYKTEPVEEAGISVHDWPFKDGGIPPQNIIRQWNALVESRQQPAKVVADANDHAIEEVDSRPTIACHCVAGLGRAPVLVCIALIEMGMAPLDAIEFIRRKRRGAFNNRQIEFLDSYKRTRGRPAVSAFRSSFSKIFKSKKIEVI